MYNVLFAYPDFAADGYVQNDQSVKNGVQLWSNMWHRNWDPVCEEPSVQQSRLYRVSFAKHAPHAILRFASNRI
jgi:hypothetical protein